MNFRILLLVLFLITSPILLFIFHAIVIKLLKLFKIHISMQKLVLACILFFNIPVLVISTAIINDYKNLLDYLYVLLVFNSFAYFYFHFFNMSETARRIKILLGIRNNKIKNITDLMNYYNYKKALLIRLDRLEQLNQIEKNNNCFKIKNKLLLRVAYLILIFRKLLGFENIN